MRATRAVRPRRPRNKRTAKPIANCWQPVRRAVVGDKSLSTSAHNVKIVTKEGVVTLRGPVTSEDEKSRVEKLAQQVAGVSSVENQLDVKTNVKTK